MPIGTPRMLKKDTRWFHEQKRKEIPDPLGTKERAVCFGYQKVPEHEKVERVLRHFNTVARKYDFMNTLLSFGIHYHWKRRAVKMLKLEPGARVIDVCGGTGDLSLLAAQAVRPSGRVILYDINWANKTSYSTYKASLNPYQHFYFRQSNVQSDRITENILIFQVVL